MPSAPIIAIGDIYEDCSFHPVRCEAVDGDSISGVSLIDGSSPRSCSLGHCSVVKLTEPEAQQRIEAFKNDGERGLMRLGGLTDVEIDEFLQKRR